MRDNNSVIYEDKFKSANNLDEIVIASTNYVNEDLKHQRKDNFREFARGDVLIRVGITSTKLNRKKESTPYGQHKESIRSGMLSDSTIPYKSYNFNNNSMQDHMNLIL